MLLGPLHLGAALHGVQALVLHEDDGAQLLDLVADGLDLALEDPPRFVVVLPELPPEAREGVRHRDELLGGGRPGRVGFFADPGEGADMVAFFGWHFFFGERERERISSSVGWVFFSLALFGFIIYSRNPKDLGGANSKLPVESICGCGRWPGNVLNKLRCSVFNWRKETRYYHMRQQYICLCILWCVRCLYHIVKKHWGHCSFMDGWFRLASQLVAVSHSIKNVFVRDKGVILAEGLILWIKEVSSLAAVCSEVDNSPYTYSVMISKHNERFNLYY